MHNDCEVVVLTFHKHGSGDTVSFYGTEGAGVSFIGNKEDIPTSPGGEIVLKLFRKFMEGIVEVIFNIYSLKAAASDYQFTCAVFSRYTLLLNI
jgi:hypothetical protein